jgi:hypothetical protein
MHSRMGSLIAGIAGLLGAACHPSTVQSASPALALPPVALSGHDTIPTAELRGRVRSAVAGYSTGASAVRIDQGRVEVRTDSIGYFIVHGLAAGPHDIQVRRLPLRPVVGTIEMPAQGGAVVDIVLEPVTVCLDSCGTEEPRAYGGIRDVQ